MTDLEQISSQEQPTEGAAPQESDSSASDTLQVGGITPQIEAALAKLPPEDAKAVREDIAQRNASYTKAQQTLASQRKALETDVQMAGVLRECLKDPEFNEYLDARNNGDLSTYFRQKAGVAGNGQGTSLEEDNQMGSVAPSENGDGMSGQSRPTGTDVELARRVEAIERERAELRKQQEIEQFTSQYPDYEEYLPMMKHLRGQLPQAGLEHLYLVAKGKATQSAGAHEQPQAAAQQETQETSAAPASQSPPLPVGGAAGSPASGRAASMEDAFAQAKAEMGIEGPIRFSE